MENGEKKEISITENNSHTKLKSSKRKNLKKNLILLLVTVIIMIIIFEIFLRLFYPQKLYDKCYEYSSEDLSNLEVELDPNLGWKLKSNFSGCRYQPDTNKIVYKTHNSKGIRLNKEIPYEKGDKKRILLLGDSFVYGFGVNDSETIAVKLQENLGENYEVIPFGVDGYGSGQEFLYLNNIGLRYNPDIVILFFYSNDFIEARSWWMGFSDKPLFMIARDIKFNISRNINESLLDIQKAIVDKSLINFIGLKVNVMLLDEIINPNNKNHSVYGETMLVFNYPSQLTWNKEYGIYKIPLSDEKPLSAFMLKYSHLYSLIYHKITNLDFNIQKISYFNQTRDGITILIQSGNYSYDIDRSFYSMTIFKEFKKMSQEKEFEFVVVNIPDKLFVSNEYQKKFLEQYYDVNESFFEFRKMDRIFNVKLLNLYVEYISLYNLAEENFNDFYFKTDPHWNPRGIELSAEYITDKLKEKKII